MLTVYSTQGSPGASTTAMHLAAHWASTDREVLLIELDPAGGSLSHNLGIQFTPGSASFVASGLPVLSNHLIDHAQDVLFESLHVMPAPASPTGARSIFNTFADFAEDLRAISENEMAVIVDGGRITADVAASGLTTAASGVVVVSRNNSQLSSLEHLKDAMTAAPSGQGPRGLAVTVGKSPMDSNEWLETCGLTFCGSIEVVSDMATDLSAYMARSKRKSKSKKWRASLEQVGEQLYPYAQPPPSGASHRSRSTAPTGTEAADGTDGAAAAPAPTAIQEPAGHEQPPSVPPVASPGLTPPMAPAGQEQPLHLPPTPDAQPGHGPSHFLPPTGDPGYGHTPPATPSPGYGHTAPATPHDPGYGHTPPPPQDPGYRHTPPPPQDPSYRHTPPATPHDPGYRHTPPPPQDPGYRHTPPPPQDPSYRQPGPPSYGHEPYRTPPYEVYAQPHHAAPHEQAPPHNEQAPPVPGEQPGSSTPSPSVADHQSPPQPEIQPTGSFREWALKLHGSNAEDMTAHRGG